jgi:sterol desaturase/sphingolipid hydroxylase (fatty acid hydroxylase superfamily)
VASGVRARKTGRTYDLRKMSRADLIRAYFTHPSVLVYLGLAVVAIAVAALTADSPWPPLAAAAVAALLYPLAEYLLHRFVLHGRYMYKIPFLATTWKRIHYDHHRDPNDLRVLFGALYTTLPTITVVALPVGWLVAGLPGAAAAFATGLLAFAFYEFCHCAQHLNFTPKSAFLRRIKQRHMAHHFHNESGNFGITSFLWDRVFGTLYETPKEVPRSPTVFNLGYTEEEAKRYPWVAELSQGDGDAPGPRRGRRAPEQRAEGA